MFLLHLCISLTQVLLLAPDVAAHLLRPDSTINGKTHVMSFSVAEEDKKRINRSEGLPRTGYLVPGRDGSGLWPDGRVVGTSSSPPPPSPSPSVGNWGLKQF